MRQITKHNRAGKKKNRISLIACMLVLVFLMTGCGKNSDGVIRITNVSYDPTILCLKNTTRTLMERK